MNEIKSHLYDNFFLNGISNEPLVDFRVFPFTPCIIQQLEFKRN